jgi:hypothetical protein
MAASAGHGNSFWSLPLNFCHYFLRYSYGGTAGTDQSPIVLYLASRSAELYKTNCLDRFYLHTDPSSVQVVGGGLASFRMNLRSCWFEVVSIIGYGSEKFKFFMALTSITIRVSIKRINLINTCLRVT